MAFERRLERRLKKLEDKLQQKKVMYITNICDLISWAHRNIRGEFPKDVEVILDKTMQRLVDGFGEPKEIDTKQELDEKNKKRITELGGIKPIDKRKE